MNYRLQDSMGFALFRATNLLKAEFGRQLRPYEITPEQFAVLGLLWEQDGLLQNHIARQLCKDRANTSRILDKLEAKGLIKRSRDPRDRRAIRVHLTSESTLLREPLESLAIQFRESAYAGIDHSTQEEIRRLMNHIIGNLT
jgi:DNA-binding MarR family transcriptional regulator